LPLEVLVVPSLQVTVLAAGVAGAAAAGAVGADLAAFCTPPWPLHAPLPVAWDVVPSLQVVGAASSARAADGASAKTPSDTIITPARIVFFMRLAPLVILEYRRIVAHFPVHARRAAGESRG
jgi:hypothetical protein